MPLFDWSVINSTIIMGELKEGFTNAQTKYVLVNELIERINGMSEIPKGITTENNSKMYVRKACTAKYIL